MNTQIQSNYKSQIKIQDDLIANALVQLREMDIEIEFNNRKVRLAMSDEKKQEMDAEKAFQILEQDNMAFERINEFHEKRKNEIVATHDSNMSVLFGIREKERKSWVIKTRVFLNMQDPEKRAKAEQRLQKLSQVAKLNSKSVQKPMSVFKN